MVALIVSAADVAVAANILSAVDSGTYSSSSSLSSYNELIIFQSSLPNRTISLGFAVTDDTAERMSSLDPF